ncbi:uncharacterized protein LOC124816202 isoform X2 [Hydra vulgaris]|uniref:uncharacterized protein LOC124816202 isoform X2 n=1 Tax=Hydra vulgaris TaxID=6087 RepID=UPI001F5E96AD|nr:uncharacterized protein LOC124816202 [Hydra vulgaris]
MAETRLPPGHKRQKLWWNNFEDVESTSKNVLQVECKLCPDVVSNRIPRPNASATGMKSHLKRKHKTVYNEVLRQEEEMKSQQAISGEKPEFLTSIGGTGAGSYFQLRGKFKMPAHFLKLKSQDPMQLRFDYEVCLGLANSNVSFHFMELPSIQQMFQAICPQYTLCSARTYAQNKLPIVYEAVKKAVKDIVFSEIKMVMRIGFTTDGWSSLACDKYNSITVHYINNNY